MFAPIFDWVIVTINDLSLVVQDSFSPDVMLDWQHFDYDCGQTCVPWSTADAFIDFVTFDARSGQVQSSAQVFQLGDYKLCAIWTNVHSEGARCKLTLVLNVLSKPPWTLEDIVVDVDSMW